ncbi:hypothetical protein AADC60_08090 [Cytobacillus pseudoceanisediminis]|uniref:Uncharacterized protein n=1 Tax=Cytobacillus pseudoceanisediminis TaxID=3051614 RepID=A0ABZ2ZLT5_9BACI
MQLITSLFKLFFGNIPSINKSEDIESFKASSSAALIKLPSKEQLITCLEGFPIRDSVILDIDLDENEPVTFYKNQDIQSFYDQVQTFIDIKDDNSIFTLKLTINKNCMNNKISVYCLESLKEYIHGLSLHGLLYTVNKLVSKNNYIYLLIQDNGTSFEMATQSIILTSEEAGHTQLTESINREKLISNRNSISNFINSSEYNLIPNDFYLIKRSADQDINELFDKICFIISTAFIADISKIHGDNQFYYRYNGYKTIENEIDYKVDTLNNSVVLFNIFSWIYNEGNLSDKIGLSRNMITLHHKVNDNETNLKDNTLNSILSGYEIYLKENVEQYIDIKNKISEFLIDMSQKSSELVRAMTDSIKNNNLLFLSFFLSIVVFNSLSENKFKDIFTKDITYISYGILFISMIYLIISIVITNIEIKRFQQQFFQMKELYNDILDEEDLKNIFKEDILNNDIKYIERKTVWWSIFWLFEIVLIFLTVVILSKFP